MLSAKHLRAANGGGGGHICMGLSSLWFDPEMCIQC